MSGPVEDADLMAFSGQAMTCPDCGDVKADVIFDQDTIATYWTCPDCGEPRKSA